MANSTFSLTQRKQVDLTQENTVEVFDFAFEVALALEKTYVLFSNPLFTYYKNNPSPLT